MDMRVFAFLEAFLAMGTLYLGASLGIPLVLAALGVKLYSDPDSKNWAMAVFACAAIAVFFFWPPMFDRMGECSRLAEIAPDPSSSGLTYMPNPELKELGCDQFPYNMR